MKEAVKEGYGGGGGLRRGITILRGIFFWGEVSLGLHRGELSSVVGGSVQGAPVCWRFWARGPGYPYDILELGSCPSWQGGTRFWAVFTQFNSRKVNKASGNGGLASDQGI
jgi:hypothetical protein